MVQALCVHMATPAPTKRLPKKWTHPRDLIRLCLWFEHMSTGRRGEEISESVSPMSGGSSVHRLANNLEWPETWIHTACIKLIKNLSNVFSIKAIQTETTVANEMTIRQPKTKKRTANGADEPRECCEQLKIQCKWYCMHDGEFASIPETLNVLGHSEAASTSYGLNAGTTS